MLEGVADLIQAKAPVDQSAMYLSGFHVSKGDPRMQMEAHHYCNQANEDMAQCVLFDGNTADARLMGIEQAAPLPFGPPDLQWSLNRDDEADPEMTEARDRRMDLDSMEARQERQDLVPLAKPQGGVDAMAGFFPDTRSIQGVTDNGDAASRPVPTFGMTDAPPPPSGR